MASKIAIQRLTNANIYMDGANLLGRAEEISLPEIKMKMSEHKALGLVGTIETASGVEKLESKIKWTSFYPDVIKKAGNPFKPVQLQVRASIQIYEGGGVIREAPVVVLLTGTFKKFPFGNFKQHDNAESESELSCTYVKQTIDGEDMIEFDVLANIYKVGGVDILADYRTNTGA